MHATSSLFLHHGDEPHGHIRPAPSGGSLVSLAILVTSYPASFCLHGTRAQLQQVVDDLVAAMQALPLEGCPQEVIA